MTTICSRVEKTVRYDRAIPTQVMTLNLMFRGEDSKDSAEPVKFYIAAVSVNKDKSNCRSPKLVGEQSSTELRSTRD